MGIEFAINREKGMPPDSVEATISPRVAQPGHKKPTEYRPTHQWEPIYADYAERIGGGPKLTIDSQGLAVEDRTVQEPAPRGELHHSKMALPIGWRCPCNEDGTLVVYGRSCPKCGRIPRDAGPGKLDGPQRCTTGRQGRDWKRVAKGRS
jgi:hypothetical protein